MYSRRILNVTNNLNNCKKYENFVYIRVLVGHIRINKPLPNVFVGVR